MEKWDGKDERSLVELAGLNTTYGQVASYVIWGDESPRNITDLIAKDDLNDALKEWEDIFNFSLRFSYFVYSSSSSKVRFDPKYVLKHLFYELSFCHKISDN